MEVEDWEFEIICKKLTGLGWLGESGRKLNVILEHGTDQHKPSLTEKQIQQLHF